MGTSTLGVGAYGVTYRGEERVHLLKTIKKAECGACLRLYQVTDGHHIDMTIADVAFANGEREVRTVDVGTSPPRLQRLGKGLRMGG
jgi:hypothetical protein